MNLEKEKKVLRELAQIKRDIAGDPVNQSRINHWTDVNDLKTEKPTIYINEVPWHELNVDDELTLVCEDPFHREMEMALRREIYTWNHLPGDMVVSDYIESPLVINDSGFGIKEESDIITIDEATSAPSRHFHTQIRSMDDIGKIIDPVISLNQEATQANLSRRQEIFDGIIDVKKNRC